MKVLRDNGRDVPLVVHDADAAPALQARVPAEARQAMAHTGGRWPQTIGDAEGTR